MKLNDECRDFVEQLYFDYAEELFRFALRKVKCQEYAEDLLHDVFTIACEKSMELAEHPNTLGWLYKTMNFLILQVQCEGEKEVVSLDECRNIASGAASIPLEIMLPAEMSETERSIFRMRFEHRLSYNDIAGQLHMTAVNCRTIVLRTINRYWRGEDN